MSYNEASSIQPPITSKLKSPQRVYKLILASICLLLLFLLLALPANAAEISIDFNSEGTEGGMGTLQLFFIFVFLSLAPSLLIMVTSFTRIIITFSFLRTALGLQQTPSNQILIGLALFLSYFIMYPVLGEINTNAIEPYMNGDISHEEALGEMGDPLKEFMIKQIKEPDINLFISLSSERENINIETSEDLMGLGMEIIVPSFITSELKRAFTIGFLLFLPFLIIDIIVSSTLMSMGMMMLPPATVAMPFKLMIFVVVDGWRLIMEMLIIGFQ